MKALGMQCYTHVGVGQIKSIVYHPTQEFHQPINATITVVIVIIISTSTKQKQLKIQSKLNDMKALQTVIIQTII